MYVIYFTIYACMYVHIYSGGSWLGRRDDRAPTEKRMERKNNNTNFFVKSYCFSRVPGPPNTHKTNRHEKSRRPRAYMYPCTQLRRA